jgi:peptidoglycan/LPS O-acetylase OafA/YrhL
MTRRAILAFAAGVAAGVLAAVAIAAAVGRPVFPDAVQQGLVAAVPATLAAMAVGWRRHRRGRD